MSQPQKFGNRYPWQRWFSKREFSVTEGVDFAGRADTFAQQLRSACRRPRFNKRVSLSFSEDGKTIFVKVYPGDVPLPATGRPGRPPKQTAV